MKSRESDWTFGDGRFCVQLCIETLCKRPTLVAHLTNFSFEFFYKNFHRRCLSTSSIPWCKKVKNDQKLKSGGGGPALRPTGGDPGVDCQQNNVLTVCVFFEWTWPFWTPLKAFREEAVWFKQRKTRRKVTPFLTPLGAARAACSADWLKIDMWENPSFDSSGSRQLVGTLRCTLSLFSDLHFNSRSSLACFLLKLLEIETDCPWRCSRYKPCTKNLPIVEHIKLVFQ